jgi:hypothetical protein
MWFAAKLTSWNDILQDAPPPLHPDYVFWGNSIRQGEANINATRIPEVDGADAESLTAAEVEGRRQIGVILEFFKAHVPGFEDAYLAGSAPFMGIRETRRIDGLYRLTTEDVLEGRRSADVVARAAYPIDIHDAQGKGTTFRQVGGDGAYDIPYGCLVPQDVGGLLLAGRAISADHQAQGSLRVMVIAMAIGQAAGAAAALCARAGLQPGDLDVGLLQAELLCQGVNLGR